MVELHMAAAEVQAAFPFVVVLDADQHIHEVSAQLASAMPHVRDGSQFADHFAAALPSPLPDRPQPVQITRNDDGARHSGLIVPMPVADGQKRWAILAWASRAAVMDELAQQQATLLELFAFDNRDFDTTVNHLLAANQNTLGVARCSLWTLRHDGTTIRARRCSMPTIQTSRRTSRSRRARPRATSRRSIQER